MTFVDSNVPMYLIGAAHPNKTAAQILLESLVAKGERLVTDAEVLQEILHRYSAINRREAIDPAIQVTLAQKRLSIVPIHYFLPLPAATAAGYGRTRSLIYSTHSFLGMQYRW